MTPTKIEWSDEVWNPVTGCSKVSPGCAKCFAERISLRFGHSKLPWTPENAAENVVLHPERLEQPLRWKKPRMVFVNSMSDLFHEEVPDEFVLAVWSVMEAAPQHTYQILTKRPERARDLLGIERPSAPPQPPYERREIPGWIGYEIDTEGVVWAKRNGEPMTPEIGDKGHRRVMLYIDGVGRRELIHRLVLRTFDRLPLPGEQSCHRDGDSANNRSSNLYWGTQADNWADSRRHRTDRRHHLLDPLDVARLRIAASQGKSGAALGRQFGISDTQARNIIRGDQWSFKVLPSVWLGVSIENARFTWRADVLREIPSAVRFISAEPLLGSLFSYPGYDECNCDVPTMEGHGQHSPGCSIFASKTKPLDLTGISWVIVGGESGHGARPMQPEWARELRDACLALEGPVCCGRPDYPAACCGQFLRTGECCSNPVQGDPECCGEPVPGQRPAYFFKQWGSHDANGRYVGPSPKAGGKLLDGREWAEFPDVGVHVG